MKNYALILTILSLLYSQQYHLEYDNLSDFVQIDPYNLNGDFSISVDAALISGTRGTLFRQINGGEIHLGFENSKIRFGVKASTCSASYGWHNIYIDLNDLNIDQSFNNYTGVYSRYSQYLKLYVNDELVAFQSINSTNLASCNLYLPVIGFESDGLLKIKSFKIWNGIALSEENFINDIDPTNNWIFDGQSQTILYDIVGNNHGTINGASWELNDLNPSLHSVPNEFSTIQEAIDSSIDGDSIFVFAGTYYENINFNGKNISLIGEDKESTIIDGNDIGRVVEIYNCFGSVLVSDFTIKNGNHSGGGGIYIYGSYPHLKNLIIRENYASIDGGGIHSHAAFPIMENLFITNNTSGQEGAGVYIENTFNDGEVIIKKSNIIGNISNTKGGGIYINSSNVSIYDSEIVYNYANNGAGGISTFGYSTNINSCTIVKNQGNPNNSNYGAGIHFDNTNSFIGNSIVYLNDYALPAISTINSTLEISYSNIEHGWEGIGNINSNPQFTNSENGDFTLQASSPCIDTGDPNSPLDPDGTRADIGAYYYHQNENSILECTDSLAYNFNEQEVCKYQNIGEYALEFNNVNDYVNIGRPLSSFSNDNITISCWINSTENNFPNDDGRGHFISNDTQPSNPQINLWMWNTGKVTLHGEGFDCMSEKSINDGYWHNVVAIKESGTLSLFIDNEFQCSASGQSNLDNGEDWYIGAHRSGGDDYAFRGYISNVKFINRNINYSEVEILFNGGNISDIIADYRFDDIAENTLFDYVGNHHGVIFGANWISSDINPNVYHVPDDYPSIQAAIDASSEGDTVLVSEGHYFVDNLTIYDKIITLLAYDGPENTIIDGNGQNKLLTIDNGSLTDTTKIIGFNFKHGHGGGIINCLNGLIIFKDIIVEESGYNTGGSLIGGSGIDKTFFIDSIIRNNTQENVPGINSATVIRCVLYGNSAWNNSTNIAWSKVINSTITNNYGPFVYPVVGYQSEVINSIIWNNGGSTDFDGHASIRYSLLPQSSPQVGVNNNISSNPIINDDFTLQSTSPCLDSGDPNSPLDPDGTRADIGAFYYHQSESSVNQCCFESYGDINCDTILDISDIIIMIDIILDLIEYSDDQIDCADVNGDSIVDISDLILLIDSILGF